MKTHFGFTVNRTRFAWFTLLYVVSLWLIAVWTVFVDRTAMDAEGPLYNEPCMQGTNMLLMTAAMLVGLLGTGIAVFFLIRLAIRAVTFDGEHVRSDVKFWKYFGILIGGGLLTIITLGIYYPWYERSLIACFTDDTSYQGEYFRFRGQGVTLFGILTVCIMLPVGIILLGILLGSPVLLVISYLLVFGFAILAEVLMIRWLIDFSFGRYRIGAKVETGRAWAFMLGQMLLTVITLGIYSPIARMKIYRYFITRSEATGEEVPAMRLGSNLRAGSDGMFLLLQSFLIWITLGIYAAWGLPRILERYVTRTSVEGEGAGGTLAEE